MTAPAACASGRLRAVLTPSCDSEAVSDAADDAHDSQRLQAMLRARQHPETCEPSADDRTFRDWRNGLGAQLSSIVGAWAHLLDRTGGAAGSGRLLASGGMRYANKARCPRRDLSCYFAPLAGCEAGGDAKEARAAKTPEGLAARLGAQLGFRRARDKWWLRRELTRFVFRPNVATAALMLRVCAELALHLPSCLPPALVNASVAAAAHHAFQAAGVQGAGAADEGGARLGRLVGLHVRRGDKRDLGAQERGEPFSDQMYVAAAKARRRRRAPRAPPPHGSPRSAGAPSRPALRADGLSRRVRLAPAAARQAVAREVGAEGVVLASSEPSTLRELPRLLQPLRTFVMPAHHFVQVPEGQTPHKVVEQTAQQADGADEGQSQIVQLLLLAATRAFVGTVTSNFGQLVTKLMGMATPAPVALDLSCAGLASMRNGSSGVVWAPGWADRDAAACKRARKGARTKLRTVR